MKRLFSWVMFFVAIVGLLFLLGDAPAAADDSAIAMSGWTIRTAPLSNSDQRASVPSIAVQTNGTLHVAFKQGTAETDPYHAFSTNGGTTWSTPQRIAPNPLSSVVDKVALAVDTSGAHHAAWIEESGTFPLVTYTLRYASGANGSWGPPEEVDSLTDPGSILSQPSIGAINGRVYLVWEKSDVGVQFANRVGGTWAAPISIVGTATAKFPEIIVDNSENLHVVYRKRGSLQDSAHYVFSNTFGTAWSTAVPLSHNVDVKDVDLNAKNSIVHVSIATADATGTIAKPFYTTCKSNCTAEASWITESLVTPKSIEINPVDAPFLTSLAVSDNDEPLVFYHGAHGENKSAEQILGTCVNPLSLSGKDFNLPTTFLNRMVKPQVVFSDGMMHMAYEQVQGQGESASLRQIHYASLDVICYSLYLPAIFK